MEITPTTITHIVNTLAEFTELGTKETYLTVYDLLPEATVAPFRRQTVITAVESGKVSGLPADILEIVSQLLFKKVSASDSISDDVRMGYIDLLSQSFGKMDFVKRVDDYPYTWTDLVQVAESNEIFKNTRTTRELSRYTRGKLIELMKAWSKSQSIYSDSEFSHSESEGG